jgi:hypothetical protein
VEKTHFIVKKKLAHSVLACYFNFKELFLCTAFASEVHRAVTFRQRWAHKTFFKTKNGNVSFATKLIALFYRFLVLKSRGANFSARTEA